MRIISVPQLLNCFHTLLFSRVTLTPLKVSKVGKTCSGSVLPNVLDDNTENGSGGDCDVGTWLVSVHVRESDADAICEVAGLVLTVPSKVVGDVAAGFAGLASAGEERAELKSLLAMETAFSSIVVSLGTLALIVVGSRGVEEGTTGGGRTEEGMSLELPSSCSIGWGSSIDASSESVAGITNACGGHNSFDTKLEKLQVSLTPHL